MKRTNIHIIGILLLLLLCIAPAMAQETAEVEPTNQDITIVSGEGAEVVATEAAEGNSGTTVIVEAQEQPAHAPTSILSGISDLIEFLVGALVGGVVVFAGGISWLGQQARAALQDPSKVVLAEKVGDSVPKEHADKLVDGLNNLILFIKEATDRQPALLKSVPPASSVSSTGADFRSTSSNG